MDIQVYTSIMTKFIGDPVKLKIEDKVITLKFFQKRTKKRGKERLASKLREV